MFLVGTQDHDTGEVLLTITAATTHPVCLTFDGLPGPGDLAERIDAIDEAAWFDDANGTPSHRRHLTRHFAEEIRAELAGDGPR